MSYPPIQTALEAAISAYEDDSRKPGSNELTRVMAALRAAEDARRREARPLADLVKAHFDQAVEAKRIKRGLLSCSFCGKTQKEVKKLIAGPVVYICDECVKLCNDIIAEEDKKEAASRAPSGPPTAGYAAPPPTSPPPEPPK